MKTLTLPSKAITLQEAAKSGKLLKIAEAAKVCRVSYRTMWQWVHDGKITALRWGATVRIPAEALYEQTSEQRRNAV